MSETTARAILEGAARLCQARYGAMWADYWLDDPGVRAACDIIQQIEGA